MKAIRLLCVYGASRSESRLRALMNVARESAVHSGAEVRDFDLAEHGLPTMIVGDDAQGSAPAVQACRESAAWADAFLIGSPEYHGSMSGALKNWFDFLYPELAGKFAGVLCTTGGGTGDLPITAIKTCFQWCHGFTLPFHVTAQSAHFDARGSLIEARVIDRATRVGHDVVRYAKVLRPAFLAAQQENDPARQGFAGFHGAKRP